MFDLFSVTDKRADLAKALVKAQASMGPTPEESRMQRKANGDFQYLDWFTQCAQVAWDANQGGRRNRFTVSEFAQAIDHNLSVQRFGLSLSSALHTAGFKRYRSGGATYYYKPGDSTGAGTGLIQIRALTRTELEQKAGI